MSLRDDEMIAFWLDKNFKIESISGSDIRNYFPRIFNCDGTTRFDKMIKLFSCSPMLRKYKYIVEKDCVIKKLNKF